MTRTYSYTYTNIGSTAELKGTYMFTSPGDLYGPIDDSFVTLSRSNAYYYVAIRRANFIGKHSCDNQWHEVWGRRYDQEGNMQYYRPTKVCKLCGFQKNYDHHKHWRCYFGRPLISRRNELISAGWICLPFLTWVFDNNGRFGEFRETGIAVGTQYSSLRSSNEYWLRPISGINIELLCDFFRYNVWKPLVYCDEIERRARQHGLSEVKFVDEEVFRVLIDEVAKGNIDFIHQQIGLHKIRGI